ncbi:MAG: hypothetical protein ACO3JL_07725, partial [Myxococcota bacterium]
MVASWWLPLAVATCAWPAASVTTVSTTRSLRDPGGSEVRDVDGILIVRSLGGTGTSAETRVVDTFPIEHRSEGDGADRFRVPANAAEPLFVLASSDVVTLWWMVWSPCAGSPTEAVSLQGDKLTLRVVSAPRADACLPQANVFETHVRGWGKGVKELRSEGAPAGLDSRWFHVPDEPRAGELQLLEERVRDRAALRRLGERIAWAYHLSGQTRASSTAYRWLSALDELHPRVVLYQTRLFEDLALSHSRGAALLVLDRLVENMPRVRQAVQSGASEEHVDVALGRQELASLEQHLKRSLRYLAQLWHHETLDRWHTCLRVYSAYLQLFPDDENVPDLLPDYASALLAAGEVQEALR